MDFTIVLGVVVLIGFVLVFFALTSIEGTLNKIYRELQEMKNSKNSDE
ncbi:hypothetical protein [Ornithinibacillus halophilus]|uniref:Uncharacterized protein n=1 Tax=Ornithinibacillus halophilus TaxID=930117 RepID=A0A1M5MMU3_9BACI|nr:hypothetical protein [Ornithinibacillus halophilus]SHG78591.1 hypothetical protein SAMN05216225_10622 [Ornithinibacillus halophilus]